MFTQHWPITMVRLLFVFFAALVISACSSEGSGDTTPPINNSVLYTLDASTTGTGTISSTPVGISCGSDCTEDYFDGTQVALTAAPGGGFTFNGWSGACTGTSSCSVSMTQSQSVVADFIVATPGTFQLVVSTNTGGTVTSSPAGINCGANCTQSYTSGTSVTLTPAPDPTYTFVGWSGACSGNTSCTVTMNQNQVVTAYFSSGNVADLCAGLIIDKVAHPMTALAKPAVGAAVTDPQFGTTIRRISNSGSTGVIKPAYSTIPAWNADESYLILYHTGSGVPGGAGHHLYNGKTYQHIKKLSINPPDLEQFYWHGTDPNILYYVNSSNKTLTRYLVSTDTKQAIRDLSSTCPSGSISGGGDPMYMSFDTDVIGLSCSSGTAFSYRISTDTVGSIAAASGGLAPIASASGSQLFFINSGAAEVRDLNMNFIRSLTITNPFDHASLGRLGNGRDTHNAVAFDGALTGSLVVNDMQDGSTRVIVGPSTGYPYPPSGTHVSALALQSPGWVAVSIVGNTSGQTVLANELLLANTNAGGQVCRVGHSRTFGKAGPRGYWAEPQVVISPSGTRLLFGSDWGGGTSVDAYVVELPSYRP